MMTIAIDFDGTLCDGAYPAIGDPMPGAAEVLAALHRQGHYIIVWTCRKGAALNDARAWLDRRGMKYHSINENNPLNITTYGGDTRKVNADIYIDDRQLGGLPSWSEIGCMLDVTIRERYVIPYAIDVICRYYGITEDDLTGRSKVGAIPTARQMFAFVAHQYGATEKEMVKAMKHDRCSVKYWLRTANDRHDFDPQFRAAAEQITAQLKTN